MLTKNIDFKNFYSKKNKKFYTLFQKLLKENNEILNSFKSDYKNSYTKETILKFKKFSEILIIGMGGSILGARAIYKFLKPKIKKIKPPASNVRKIANTGVKKKIALDG